MTRSTRTGGRAGPGTDPRDRPTPDLPEGYCGAAGDQHVVLDEVDAAGHPGGVYRSVVLGPGADGAGQVHRVPVGVHPHVAVVEDQRVAVQRLLDPEGDVSRVHVRGDVDLVPDVAHASEPGDRQFGRGAFGAIAHRAGQHDVAVARGRLHRGRHGGVRRQRVVRHRGQDRVVPVALRRQDHLEMVVHPGHALDALGGGRRLLVLRVAGYGSVERYLSAHVLDRNVAIVDERVEVEFGFDSVTDVHGLAHGTGPSWIGWPAGRRRSLSRSRLAAWSKKMAPFLISMSAISHGRYYRGAPGQSPLPGSRAAQLAYRAIGSACWPANRRCTGLDWIQSELRLRLPATNWGNLPGALRSGGARCGPLLN